jgi:hypothetical protein
MYVSTWFERDRACVIVYAGDNESDAVLLELWDEAVFEAIEDGFLDAKDLEQSAIDYATYLQG